MRLVKNELKTLQKYMKNHAVSHNFYTIHEYSNNINLNLDK